MNNVDETAEKLIRSKCRFNCKVEIEYAFGEEQRRDFGPIEVEMKEQTMSASEHENDSEFDESD